MAIRIKARATKKVYNNGDFYIWGFTPVGKPPVGIVLNKYFSFTCKGNGLSWVTEGKEYELEVEESANDKYGTSYSIIAVPSLNVGNLEELSRDESMEILMEITTERQATNILNAYPDFIYKVLTEGKDSIDVKKIYGVGEAYLNAYTRELNVKYKYLNIMSKLKQYKLDIEEAKLLCDIYKTDDEICNALKTTPYSVLIGHLKRKFENADRTIIEIDESFRQTEERCAYLILNVLEKNQEEGSTRINANAVYEYIMSEYTQANDIQHLIVPTATTNELFYYDEQTKDLAIMATYLAECRIADFIKEKINNPHVLDIDYTKYKSDGDFTLTDAQLGLLENFCKYDFMILAGYAGCVDKDTEFFNGRGWKKISEYEEGDLVLQWNKDGSTNLIKPIRYLKEPCNEMYHFETKYGLNQMLSKDHRVVTLSQKGVLKERTMEEVKNIQESNGFKEKFITTFSYSGEGIDLKDSEIKLMCAVICDGSFDSKSNSSTCRLHIKKERKKNRLREICCECGIELKEKESNAIGYTDFYFTAPRREKIFSDYWYSCNQHQLQIICDNICFWDGSESITNNGILRKNFSTTQKQTADFLQFAFSACNHKTTIYIDDRRGKTHKALLKDGSSKIYTKKSICYNLIITNRNLVGMCADSRSNHTNTKIETVKTEDGFKYCFTVPSSYLVLRRENKIFVTGNCGKTASVKNLIKLMEDNNISYTLLSSTGKASKVLADATKREASTIHKKCFQGDINSDCIIVDECGMVNLDTFIMLLNSITNENAKIILSGDNAQLSSIGLSKIFDDLIKSESVPLTMLTEIFRYKSDGALFVATNVRNGRSFFNDTEIITKDKNCYKAGSNYKFIEAEEDDILDKVVEEYNKLISKGIKPIDIAILTPFNKGEVGTYKINNLIQQEINPMKHGEKYLSRKIGEKEIVFKENDIVINTKNDYNAVSYEAYLQAQDSCGLLTDDDIADSIIVNGQVGIVRQVLEEGLVIQFDENLIYMSKQKLVNLLLSYSISCHKSQGASIPYIIYVVSEQHKKMLTRGLLYVASTRCTKSSVAIGSTVVFENALSIVDNDLRDTFLKDLMIEQ